MLYPCNIAPYQTFATLQKFLIFLVLLASCFASVPEETADTPTPKDPAPAGSKAEGSISLLPKYVFWQFPPIFLLVDGKGAAKKGSGDTTGEPTGKTEAEGEGEKKPKFELPEEFTNVSPSCAQTRTCLHEFSPSNFGLDFYVSCSHWDAALVNT